ncbi:hypothetical protein SAMN05216266_103307 [Amycolatopsis marina]|uniref:PPE family protein n=1 Tax=Amycolatopsis marina TaxID=490629 RepID=A0A1I0XP95_9PSEU|nr:hypothetical protein [Amycolatopsis marina]SFB01783.1 hypothetical protein SAMN05216266_103307 [Amycolatopsis marina]
MNAQNPQAPAELTDRQIAELSPAEREQYFQDRATAGVDDGGLFGWFRRMQAQAAAAGEADRASQDSVRDLSSGADIQFVEGLRPSDANYQGHEHTQMTTYITQNLDPDQVGEVSEAYHQLHMAFKEFASELKSAVSKSEHEWEGEAASDARNYFTSLQEWSDGNSTNAKLASETIYQQSEAASTAKNQMPEEIPFNWDSEMEKWGSNPLDLIGNINKSMETYKASNEAHSQAATVMAQYDTDLYTAASKQPVFAEPPKFGAGSGKYDVTPPRPGDNSTGASGFVGGPSGVGQGSIPSGGGSGGSGWGGGNIPGGGGSGIPGGGGGGGGYTPPITRAPGIGTGSVPVGSTRPSGYRPPNFGGSRRGGGGGGSTGFGGMGPMPMGPMGGGGGGAGGGSDYNSKLGRGGGGGFGPGGGGAGAGAGAGSGPASGAAKPGGVGAAEAAAGRGGAGAMGAGGGRGAMGGGMGAGMGGGRGGKGGEDEDHQRPTYLVEGDPDEVFGTDQRTAPPVIGE